MKNIIIYDNFYKPEANLSAENATNFLINKNINCYVKKHSFSRFQNQQTSDFLHIIDDDYTVQDADFIATFGGDGTILAAARQYINEEIPIVGFNVGNLGFLAEFSINSLENELENLLNNQFKIITRATLLAQYENSETIALNDFVIEKKNNSKMITVRAFANEQYIGDYRSDGLIIATPTGSTAYSLACGGPILAPDSNVLCITPISPHSLTLRPLVMSNDKKIKLQVFSASGEANLVADGYNAASINSGERLNISLSDKKIKLIVPTKNNYFDILRNKLLWAEYSFNFNKTIEI